MNKFLSQYKIYYENTDAGGVVYHANYLKFFERARTDLLEKKGFLQNKIKIAHQALFVVRKCDIEYKSPANFEDKIIVETQILKIGKTYIDFFQTIILEKNQNILANAKINVACVDCENMKPKKIPVKIFQFLNNRTFE